jgi:hypothetical protein
MIPIILAIGAGGVMIAVVMMVHRANDGRTEAIRATAARMGWMYRDAVPFDTIPKLDRFELFTQGRSRKLTNLMTSPAGDPRAVLFDYTYTTGGGKSQSTHRQTVFYGVSDTMDVPTFSLRPQSFFHTIAKAFGYQDIDLERRPVFSDMFLLRGDDEGRVRDAFSGAVAEFFEMHSGVCAAGVGREVLYWRPGKRVGGDDIESFVNEGMELAGRFRTPPPAIM